MKTILRLGTVGAVGVAALAFAGNALATQRLSVTQSATSLTIKVTQDATDQQPSKIQIYVISLRLGLLAPPSNARSWLNCRRVEVICCFAAM